MSREFLVAVEKTQFPALADRSEAMGLQSSRRKFFFQLLCRLLLSASDYPKESQRS
jgi:hypothetical protein